MNRYEDLKIWKKAMDLVEDVYLLMKQLPNDEKFALISQIKRSSISIPSNIAEGAGRNSKKEFRHFLSIANGSTSELETQLILVHRLKFVKKDSVKPIIKKCNEIRKMSYALQKSLN
ncbi:four helix bundle protein [Zobellia galactanivorans]|uniref:Bacterial 23S rRNA protein n=1 Tax=Zobellia galactanivorans (strain DSM 12802 / CCUG 47099 / CIP 106680 / NCIMB 13871 / Dsij) TaxID=63186 RepID=G0L440_ZOBGA|nr:four helix bundle protein [Zobellia galactanivorans]MBU3025776.1 four helix bundle protein [Zobellia galactanivorans]MDO6808988.1 four helix bundle protein [Zobellia galactanivorans]CAZ98646.1 Bacterial 23S rRNA protein [Zobellia galactanivorans]